MHISKEVDYGLRALIVLASRQNVLLNSKEIAQEFSIPYNFLSLILPKLVKAQMIESLQGPKGGYRLLKSPENISFFDVICALDGEMNIMDCNQDGVCDLESFCSMAGIWHQVKEHFQDYFAQITLADCLKVKKNR